MAQYILFSVDIFTHPRVTANGHGSDPEPDAVGRSSEKGATKGIRYTAGNKAKHLSARVHTATQLITPRDEYCLC